MTASPCIKLCVVDEASGLCTGCWRTLAEIAAWGSMGEAEQRRVVAALAERRTRVLCPEDSEALAPRQGETTP